MNMKLVKKTGKTDSPKLATNVVTGNGCPKRMRRRVKWIAHAC